MSRTPAAARVLADANARGLVVLTGGPTDPRWYFADDVERLAQLDGWPYVATGDYEPHPTIEASGLIHRRKLRAVPSPRQPGPPTCTYLRCDVPPTKQLQPSTGGRPWYGCDQHAGRMQDALAVGMAGATNGTAWVTVTHLTKGSDR